MLFPKKFKYKKHYQKIRSSKETSNLFLLKGDFGLKTIQNKEFNGKQIEIIRKMFVKKSSKSVKVWLNIFPHFSKTKKPSENRMGKGKGNINYWYFFVKTGRIVFEFYGCNKLFLNRIKKSIFCKFPFKTKLIHKKF